MRLLSGLWRVGWLLLAAFTAGCLQSESDTTPTSEGQIPVSGGTVVIAFPTEPDVLNSLITASSYTGQVLDVMMDGLVEMGEDLQWYPRIASHWDLSPDSLMLTYHLNPWNWSDGAPLTAYDVVSSLELFIHPDVASQRRRVFDPIISVVALDSSTVRYEFSTRQMDPVGTAFHSLLPHHLTSTYEPANVRDWPLNESPLSAGAYILENWEHNREIVLSRNPRYPGPAPFLDRIVFKIIPDRTARVIALETGEVDFVEGITPESAKRLADNDGVAIYRIKGRDYGYLVWNLRNPIFADPRTRKALSLGIDRQRFIDTLLGGFGSPASSLIPPAIWAHNPSVAADPYDPVEASRLLAEVGWVDGDGDGILEFDGRKFSFEILTRQGDPVRANGVVIIQKNLEQLGIEVTPRILELATSLDLVRRGQFAGYLGLYQASLIVDPSVLVHSEATDQRNYGMYHNELVDSLLALALAQPERELALPIWCRLQEVLAEDMPMACLYYPERLVGVSNRLQHVRPHMLSPFNNINEWWIAETDRKYLSPGS
ncbi:MAG: ABC transporter substrate-binding protein [bacterium]